MSEFSGGAPLWTRFINPSPRTEEKNVSRGWTIPASSERPPPSGRRLDRIVPLPSLGKKMLRSPRRRDHWSRRVPGPRHRDWMSCFPMIPRALVESGPWDSLVKSRNPIPLRLPPFMGITDLDISAAPFFEELLPNSPHFWMAGSWWRTMPLSMRIHRRGIFLRAGRQATAF